MIIRTIIKTVILLIAIFFTRNVSAQYNFSFRYYQVYKDDIDFDTVQLWTGAKLKKTFENKGTFYYNGYKKSLKIKLRDTDYEDMHYVFATSKDYLFFNNGWRYFKFIDPRLGPSVAIYQWPKKVWIIYRQNSLPKKS